jgi:uncharacterized membrane protein
MGKRISVGVLAASVIVIIIGFAMSKSVKIAAYPYYSGGLSGWTIVMLLIGVVGIIVGVIGLIRSSKEEE